MLALGLGVGAEQNHVNALFAVVDFDALDLAVFNQRKAVAGVYLLVGNR